MKKLIILAASLALVASFAMTAAADDWNFYGSSRVSTWWTDTETIGTPGSANDFAQGLQGNSRIGASVKVSDELTGGFEYGTGVNVRLLYGEWNFGGGSFLVGQTYSPLNMFYSNQVYGSDSDLLGYGGVYGGREPMLRLKFNSFQIALVELEEDDDIGGTNEAAIPAIEAKYSLSLDPVSLALVGGYQTYESKVDTTVYDVDSYVVGLGAAANFGMGYLKGNIYMGQNVDNLIWIGTGGSTKAGINGTTTDDSEAFGYILVAGAKINDMFSVELGYGNAETELDTDTVANEVTSYYAQTTITFAPGVFVVPEVGVIDGNEVDETEVTYFGAKWQINF